MKEMAELWSDQRARTPNPKKKTKRTLSTQFTRRDSHISHLSFVFQILEEILAYLSECVSENKYQGYSIVKYLLDLTDSLNCS